MAEEDNNVTPEDVKKAEEAVEQLIELDQKRTKSLEERLAIEKQIASEIIETLQLEAAEREKTIRREIEEEEKKAQRLQGLARESAEAKVELLKKLQELESESEIEEMTEKMELIIDAQGSVFSKLSSELSKVTESINGNYAAAIGLFKLMGVPMPSPRKALKELGTTIEESTRSLIPFNRNTDEAIALMNRLRDQSALTGLPMSELADGANKAASSFALFGAEEATVRAELSALEAQMGQMGVSGASDVISSLITEGGIESVSEAVERFKALTSTMQDFGVTPQQLKKDFDSLIPTFAMFGSSADINIAKASLAAQKARVSIGAITAFADQFEGYSGAAEAAQRINAIFGKPIIRDPAELVRTFYTMGKEGVVSLVREKMITAGFTEADFEGAAGAARLRALSKTLGITAQEAQRILTAEDITPEEISGIMDATGGGAAQAAGAKTFDETARMTIDFAKEVEASMERAAAEFAEGLGFQVGDIITKFTPILRAMGADVEAASGDLGESFRPTLGDAINEGQNRLRAVMPDASAAGELNEATKKNTEALNANTEALRQFVSNSDNSREITINLDGKQIQHIAIGAVNNKGAGKIIPMA